MTESLSPIFTFPYREKVALPEVRIVGFFPSDKGLIATSAVILSTNRFGKDGNDLVP